MQKKSSLFKHLYPSIERKLEQGFTHAEVIEFLRNEHNLELAKKTFSNYLYICRAKQLKTLPIDTNFNYSNDKKDVIENIATHSHHEENLVDSSDDNDSFNQSKSFQPLSFKALRQQSNEHLRQAEQDRKKGK